MSYCTVCIHHPYLRKVLESQKVDSRYINMFLFYRLLDVLTILGQKVDCYKVSLECKDDVVKFYQQFGFDKEEGQNYMVQRFHE